MGNITVGSNAVVAQLPGIEGLSQTPTPTAPPPASLSEGQKAAFEVYGRGVSAENLKVIRDAVEKNPTSFPASKIVLYLKEVRDRPGVATSQLENALGTDSATAGRLTGLNTLRGQVPVSRPTQPAAVPAQPAAAPTPPAASTRPTVPPESAATPRQPAAAPTLNDQIKALTDKHPTLNPEAVASIVKAGAESAQTPTLTQEQLQGLDDLFSQFEQDPSSTTQNVLSDRDSPQAFKDAFKTLSAPAAQVTPNVVPVPAAPLGPSGNVPPPPESEQPAVDPKSPQPKADPRQPAAAASQGGTPAAPPSQDAATPTITSSIQSQLGRPLNLIEESAIKGIEKPLAPLTGPENKAFKGLQNEFSAKLKTLVKDKQALQKKAANGSITAEEAKRIEEINTQIHDFGTISKDLKTLRTKYNEIYPGAWSRFTNSAGKVVKAISGPFTDAIGFFKLPITFFGNILNLFTGKGFKQ